MKCSSCKKEIYFVEVMIGGVYDEDGTTDLDESTRQYFCPKCLEEISVEDMEF